MKNNLFYPMTHLRRRNLVSLGVALLGLPVLAQFRVEVSGVGLTQMPIAIAAFRGEAQSPQKIAAIVTANLERSGVFRAIDTEGLVADESTRPDLGTWRQKGADALVTGSVTPLADGRFDVRLRLWDVVRGQDLGGAKLCGDIGRLTAFGAPYFRFCV